MAESKHTHTHTPGPWRVAKTALGQTVIDAESIGEIVCRIEEWSPEQDAADARLIAAAPDMFEALRAVLPVLEAVQRQYAQLAKSHGMGGDGPVLEAVRAALSKASPHV